MQLKNIILTNVFVILLLTGPVRGSEPKEPSFKEARATFKRLEGVQPVTHKPKASSKSASKPERVEPPKGTTPVVVYPPRVPGPPSSLGKVTGAGKTTPVKASPAPLATWLSRKTLKPVLSKQVEPPTVGVPLPPKPSNVGEPMKKFQSGESAQSVAPSKTTTHTTPTSLPIPPKPAEPVTGSEKVGTPSTINEPIQHAEPAPQHPTPEPILVPEQSVADRPEAIEFRNLLETGHFVEAEILYDCGDDELKEYYGKQLFALGEDNLLEMVESNEFKMGSWILRMLVMHGDQSEELFYVNFIQDRDVVLDALSHVDIFCKPDKVAKVATAIQSYEFLNPDFLQSIIARGIEALFQFNKMDCINRLIPAFGGNEPLNSFREMLIVQIFYQAAEFNDERNQFVKSLFAEPEISSTRYETAMMLAHSQDPDGETFKWLWDHADRFDLSELESNIGLRVKSMRRWFKDEESEKVQRLSALQDAAKEAGAKAGVETRQERRRRERIDITHDTLNKYAAPPKVIDMIAGYDPDMAQIWEF